MQGLYDITKNSMKKKKGDILLLFALISLGAMLLYTSISVSLGTGQMQDLAYERTHTADFFYMANEGKEKLPEIFSSQEEVAEYEDSPCFYFQNTEYRKEKNGGEEKKQMPFILGKLEEKRTIGKVEGSENREFEKGSIFLPYYMKVSEGFELHDTFYLTIGEEEYSFEVKGFVENVLFGTPLNVGVYEAFISQEFYEELAKENEAAKAAEAAQYRMRLKEGEDSFDFDKKISVILTRDVPELMGSHDLGVNWSTMKDGAAMMSKISMGIILVFSLLLVTVVLIIIRFSIHNSMEMNRKNIGILMAAGYTTRQLNLTAVMEMGILTFFGVIFGIGLGIFGGGIIGHFQGMMLGIRWEQGFDRKGAAITAMILFAIVIFVAYFSGRAYKKMSVLHALRGGIEVHNFKKNYFSFDKTNLPVNLALAGKNILGEKKKNLSIFGIVVLLAFASCTGFELYENFGKTSDLIFKMIGNDFGDMMLAGEDLDKAGEELEKWQEAESVLYGSNISIHMESRSEETGCTCSVWREPEDLKNEMVVSGRLPRYENEIMLSTRIAEILDVAEGDSIYVTGSGERMSYVVSGIDQKINNMGLRTTLTEQGAKRLNREYKISALAVYVQDGTDVGELISRTKNEFPDLEVSDSKLQAQGVLNGVVLMMTVICLIFVFITVFVVVMVEILLMQSRVTRERKHFGIDKAIGFTTGQLVRQTMMMNLPVIFAGAVTGAVLSIYLMEPMTVTGLSFCGMKTCPLALNPFWLVMTVLGILVIAAASAFIVSVKIRKISPVSMLAEE
ncbi:MAG: ABC transporter permease [Roseburia sp.]|nr:ABC transporter permease [Roseburia sp.]